MPDLQKLAEQIYADFEGREDESEKLDDIVHDAASSIGSSVNNGGLESQILFLLEQGYTVDSIYDAMDEHECPSDPHLRCPDCGARPECECAPGECPED